MSDTPPPPPPPPPPAAPQGVFVPAEGPPTGPLGKPRSKGLVILLTIITFLIWTIVWSYQNGEELKQRNGTGLGGVPYLFITWLLAPITMFMMASEVEKMYRREGLEPRITTLWGLWFLLPIIGNFIWYFRIQNALNEYWVSHGSTVDPGL